MTTATTARIAVTRTNIIGTRFQVHDAWVQDDGGRSFGTITTIDGRWFGRIGTERLPREIDALPVYSEERAVAYRRWRDNTYAGAYALIRCAFPEAAEGTEDMGRIESQSDAVRGETRFIG